MGTLRFVPPSNRRADVLEILRSVQGPVRTQPGCAAFDIYDDRGPDSAVLLVERTSLQVALGDEDIGDVFLAVEADHIRESTPSATDIKAELQELGDRRVAAFVTP